MKPLVEELEWVAPHDLFHALAADPFALFLDSATAGPERDPALHGRWSFIAIEPFQHLVWRHGENGKPFDLLKDTLASLAPVETGSTTTPFPGGAAGFFGYGLGRTLEHLPPEDRPFAIDDQHFPDMALGFYDLVLAFDMVQNRAFIVSTGLPESKPAARLKRAETRMEKMRKRISSLSNPSAFIPSALPEIASNFTREGYERAVAQVIRRWVNDNGRWNSPKYLGGESYGTTRTAMVARELEGGTYNDVGLNGLILISTILDFAAREPMPGNEMAYVVTLPNMAAAA